MSTKKIFISVLVGWPIVVLLALVSRVIAADSPLAGTEYAAWLFLAFAPVLTCVVIARSRPSRSITQVLYDAEHAGDPKSDKDKVRHGG